MKLIERMKAFTGGGVGFWGTILATVVSAVILAALPGWNFWRGLSTDVLTWLQGNSRQARGYLASPVPIPMLGMLALAAGWVAASVLLALRVRQIYEARKLTDLDRGFLAVLLIADHRDVTDALLSDMLRTTRVQMRLTAQKLQSMRLVSFYVPPVGPSDVHYKLDKRGMVLVTDPGFDSDAVMTRATQR